MQPQQSVESERPGKTSDLNHFSLVGWAGDVDMRDVVVVASDHACDQKTRRKEEKGKEGEEKGGSHFCIHDPQLTLAMMPRLGPLTHNP